MLFKTGDFVVHVAYGVGQVVGLAEQSFPASQKRMYYEVSLNNGTVWVPADVDGPGSLRPLSKRPDLEHCRRLLKSAPVELDADPRKRQAELSERLKSGSMLVSCEIVRDLTARSWKKSLNEADMASLRKAREVLGQEWATIAGIPLIDVNREIEALLRDSRQSPLGLT